MAINQSESTLYARAGRPKTRQELGQEGARIRNAMKELRKISAELSAESAASLIERFSFFSVADSAEATESAGENRMTTLRSNMRNRALNSSTSSADVSDTIAKHIFTLFDFDYYEYTSSAILSKIETAVLEEMKDLEKFLPKPKKGKRLTEEQMAERSEITDKIVACKKVLEILSDIEDMETLEERWDALMNIRSDKQHSINMLISRIAIDDVASQISEVLENIRNKAPEIIAQHLDIVMNHAFSGLKDLPEAEWDAVCRKFNTMVGSLFHWDQVPAVMETALDMLPKHPDVAEETAAKDVTIKSTIGSNTFGY